MFHQAILMDGEAKTMVEEYCGSLYCRIDIFRSTALSFIKN